MPATPLLQDVEVGHHYDAGDRILATVSVELDKDQRRKTVKSVEAMTGTEVAILLVDQTKVRMILHREGCEDFALFRPAIMTEEAKPEAVNINLTKVNLQTDDRLIVWVHPSIRKPMEEAVKWWAGDNVEVVMVEELVQALAKIG